MPGRPRDRVAEVLAVGRVDLRVRGERVGEILERPAGREEKGTIPDRVPAGFDFRYRGSQRVEGELARTLFAASDQFFRGGETEPFRGMVGLPRSFDGRARHLDPASQENLGCARIAGDGDQRRPARVRTDPESCGVGRGGRVSHGAEFPKVNRVMNSPMRLRIPILLSLLLATATAGAGELVEKIVARVNDRLITNSEFQKRFEVFISSPQAGNNPLEARKKLLKELIDEKLLEERAKELSVQATDEEVESAVERVKRQYNLATDAEFEAALKTSNLNREDLKRQMRNTITLQKVVGRDISSKLDLTDDALRLEYERRKEQLYKVPEQAQVSEIVIRFDPKDEAARARAAARIEEARTKVAAGTPFADVAKEYSEGNARERGGALGSVSRGELVTALDAAVFSEKPEEYPAPVLLSSSIHLFQVRDRKAAGYRPFADVKEDLRARIADDLYDKKYAEYIEKLRRDAFIKIYDPALATTTTATPPAEEKKPS